VTGATGPTGVSSLGAAYEAARASGPSGVAHAASGTAFPPTPLTTVATLTGLPAGSYVIRGVTNVKTPTGWSFICTLTAESDTNTAENEGHSGYDAGLNVTTQLLHTFAGTGTVTLGCGSEGSAGGDTWSARNTTIVAVPVTGVSVAQVTG
jgi:hypothetical protein